MTSGRYFSKSVPHKEIPRAFYGCFGLPGEPGQWILDSAGRRRVFVSADEAELTGYRILIAKLNIEGQKQQRPPKEKKQRQKSEVERVFERFEQ